VKRKGKKRKKESGSAKKRLLGLDGKKRQNIFDGREAGRRNTT